MSHPLTRWPTHIADLAVWLPLLVGVPGVAATISTDTIIGPGSPLNGQRVAIIDGQDGPTTVHLIDGGYVDGFSVTGESLLLIDGGTVSDVSFLSNRASVVQSSGVVACTSDLCRASDFEALVVASDFAQLTVRGGVGPGRVRLGGMSRLTIEGQGLSISEFRDTWFIRGTLADGTPLGGLNPLGILLDGGPSGRVFLVPEPNGSMILLMVCLAPAVGVRLDG